MDLWSIHTYNYVRDYDCIEFVAMEIGKGPVAFTIISSPILSTEIKLYTLISWLIYIAGDGLGY